MNFTTMRNDWLGNVRGDVLAGMVGTFALIPKVIAFFLWQASIRRSGCSPRS